MILVLKTEVLLQNVPGLIGKPAEVAIYEENGRLNEGGSNKIEFEF